MFENVKALSIPEGIVTKIESLGKILWQAIAYKNWIPYSVDTNGSPYNGGLGYKIGYRVRSGGVEAPLDGQACSGFMPCKGGDVLRFGFSNFASVWTDDNILNTYLNFSDNSKTNLGQMTSQPANYGIFEKMPNEYKNIKKVNGFWEYTVVDGYNIGFVRFTIPHKDSTHNDPTKFIVTVNEEIVL